MEQYQITTATPTDIPSLSTIFQRSFHPVNAYMRNALPDTPRMREWWSEVYKMEMDDETYQVLVAKRDAKVLGALHLRRLEKNSTDAAVWTAIAWCEDMDHVAMKAMTDGLASEGGKSMKGPHYGIELFAVDHDLQGQGIGSMLLRRACGMADAEGVEMCVQANSSAKDFYCRVGFEVKGEVRMPGDVEYVECFLVRRAST